jgi:hypothetical protein
MKLTITLLIYLFSLSLTAGTDQNLNYKSLDYKETKKDSQSKYFRINNIESYLSKLKNNIQNIDKNQNTKNVKSLEMLYKKIEDINKKLSTMEEDIKTIKTELNLNK